MFEQLIVAVTAYAKQGVTTFYFAHCLYGTLFLQSSTFPVSYEAHSVPILQKTKFWSVFRVFILNQPMSTVLHSSPGARLGNPRPAERQPRAQQSISWQDSVGVNARNRSAATLKMMCARTQVKMGSACSTSRTNILHPCVMPNGHPLSKNDSIMPCKSTHFQQCIKVAHHLSRCAGAFPSRS